MTPAEILKSNNLNCSPVLEALIGQKYISDIWVHSNVEHVIFNCEIHKQFEGTMHKGMSYESTWEGVTTGWIEDGKARKGETVASAAFFTFADAMNWVNAQTLLRLIEVYGSIEEIAV